AYHSQGDYESAISFYQQSLEIFQQIGDRSGIASSLGNLGNAYKSQGDYESAISFYQQSLEIQQQIGDKPGEIRSLQNLSIAHSQLGQYQQAISYNNQLLELQGLDALPTAPWFKSFIRFAQKGWFNFALCFIAGVVAFPFALLWIIALFLYRRIRRTINN
ncbi:tetratricopeptide repeat protein, partial [Roseofilum capinflatum]